MPTPPQTRSRLKRGPDQEIAPALATAKRSRKAVVPAPVADATQVALCPPVAPPKKAVQAAPLPVTKKFIKDANFYREDGNCILRVEDTLFKVHRHYLTPSGETTGFTPIFADSAVGQNDEAPIVLENATLSQLRAFLRYAYSSFFALLPTQIPDADLPNLIDTLWFTDNYHISSMSRWAKSMLYEIISRNKAVLKACDVDIYVALLYLDCTCDGPSLRLLVKDAWEPRLRSGELSPAIALDVANTVVYRSLQGIAYYAQLKAIGPDIDSVKFAALALPERHKIPLLIGALSLARYWECAIAYTPALDLYGPLCAKKFGCDCEKRWQSAWGAAVRKTLCGTYALGVDVLAKLSVLKGHLSAAESSMCPAVARATKDSVQGYINSIALADHFLGPVRRNRNAT
ncbi:hypothetical protein B0H15DRAFT_296745 [Mycena belliarum]|uniref:BTB domain-containing protein n=1 Tax=Mycena belliarum TaxID=1033014 RepID=A0AAD6U2I6_9AGAR|nr:hypothetical protein B0H15DRAFT_296745 [Mycena belliae]